MCNKTLSIHIIIISVLFNHSSLLSLKSNEMPLLPKSTHLQSKEEKQIEFPKKLAILRKALGRKLYIPSKKPCTIRIASYNVHNWRGSGVDFNSPIKNFQDQYNALKRINADIIILQEVDRNEKDISKFTQLGYKHSAFVGGPHKKSNFGNMILSKLPFHMVIKKNYKPYKFNNKTVKHPRAFVKVEICLSCYGKKNLVIYGTHFAVENNEMRLAEAQELIDLIKKHDANKNVIIAADFNTHRGSQPLNYLEQNGFIDNFTLAKVKPGFTHWSGTVIDYLYTKFIDLKIYGTFIYYSGASDHLPIVTDINL